jgi:hypothetical protein
MALQSTPALRWSVFGGMAATMLGGVALAFWPMVSADRALQTFCHDQAVGTPMADVQARAQALGYTATPVDTRTLRIDDPAGFGRRQCDLALDSQARIGGPKPLA